MISNDLLGQLFNAIVLLEVITAVVATCHIKKYWKTPLKYFFLYLWLIALTEVVGTYLFERGIDNVLLYNISKIIQYNYILFLFFNYIHTDLYRKVLKVFFAIFNIGLVINLTVGKGPLLAQPSFAFTLVSLFISIAVMLFFYEAVRTELVLRMSRYLIVWIAAGLITFHLVNLPLFAFANSMEAISPKQNDLLLIKFATNVIMYFTFIIGFVWSREQYNS